MKRIYISTIARGENIDSRNHGFLYLVDWETKQVLRKRDMFPEAFPVPDGNPRGGIRGWRGISFRDRHVVVANNDSLVFFSPDLRTVSRIISYPWFTNLHDISTSDEGTWISVTGTDSVATFEWTGNLQVWPLLRHEDIWQEVKPWVEERGRNRFIPDPDVDYRGTHKEDTLHFNSIREYEGQLFGIFNSLHMIVQIAPRFRIIYAPPVSDVHQGADIKNPHSLVVCNKEAFVCNSLDSSIASVNILTGRVKIIYMHHGMPDSKVDFIENGWLRGMDYGDKHLFAGCGLATVVEVDPFSGELVSEHSFSPNSLESTFSVFLHPEDWTK